KIKKGRNSSTFTTANTILWMMQQGRATVAAVVAGLDIISAPGAVIDPLTVIPAECKRFQL
ncbi:MAG: hypothetical protein WAM42_17840, partial [Candidatus Nitrosopolaris sp.]